MLTSLLIAPLCEAEILRLAESQALWRAASQAEQKIALDKAVGAKGPVNKTADGIAAAEWSEVEPIAERAVRELLGMRAREGAALAAELGGRLGACAPSRK